MKQNQKLYNGKTEKELLINAKNRLGFKIKCVWDTLTLEEIHAIESVLDSELFNKRQKEVV